MCPDKVGTRLDLGFSANGNGSTMRGENRGHMEPEIIWRNPLPLARIEHTLQKISNDQFGAVYAVTNLDLVQEFELILCAA